MSLVTTADVEAALGRPVTDDIDHLLNSASDLAAAYLGGIPDPVDPAVTRAVADMVVACLTKPAVTTADYDASGYNAAREVATVRVGVESATTTGPWLTKAIRQRLQPFRLKTARSAYTIDLTPGGDDGDD